MSTPLITTPTPIPEKKSEISNSLFINWQGGSNEFKHSNLLDNIDIEDYKTIFFDPVGYAIAYGLWSSDDNLTTTKYTDIDEKVFITFITKISHFLSKIQKFLDGGGCFVIRSNIPDSHIKIRKITSKGSQAYTESVLSSFFWLEDIIGKYTLKFSNIKSMKFLKKDNPFNETLGNTAIDNIQAVTCGEKGKQEIIALTGSNYKIPAISKIIPKTNSGCVYIIPIFSHKDEQELLLKTFKEINKSKQKTISKPKWVEYYNNLVDDLNPFRKTIEQIELELTALNRQKQVAEKNHKEFEGLINLLYNIDDNYFYAIITSMKLLGYNCTITDINNYIFIASENNENENKAIFGACGNESGVITIKQFQAFYKSFVDYNEKKPIKGFFIGNADCLHEPLKRDKWFDQEVIELARQKEICLIPSYELFTSASFILYKTDNENIDQLKNSIRRDLLNSETMFKVNRKKYNIRL